MELKHDFKSILIGIIAVMLVASVSGFSLGEFFGFDDEPEPVDMEMEAMDQGMVDNPNEQPDIPEEELMAKGGREYGGQPGWGGKDPKGMEPDPWSNEFEENMDIDFEGLEEMPEHMQEISNEGEEFDEFAHMEEGMGQNNNIQTPNTNAGFVKIDATQPMDEKSNSFNLNGIYSGMFFASDGFNIKFKSGGYKKQEGYTVTIFPKSNNWRSITEVSNDPSKMHVQHLMYSLILRSNDMATAKAYYDMFLNLGEPRPNKNSNSHRVFFYSSNCYNSGWTKNTKATYNCIIDIGKNDNELIIDRFH